MNAPESSSSQAPAPAPAPASRTPIPVTVTPDRRPQEVVIISHSPLFYWWPVWAVGFLMAAISYWHGDRVAFVPPGAVAERAVRIEGREGEHDVVIAPEGKSLATVGDSDELAQPRLRMTASNNPGVIWAMTLCLVIVITHLKLRGLWSILVLSTLAFVTILLAVFGLWDPILRALWMFDIHVSAFGFLAISFFLFVIWAATFFLFDPLVYIVLARGQLRVRMVIGEGEKVFDVRGMKVERHRDDIFRHWLLGLGSGDLTIYTAGANSQQFEVPNVIGLNRKMHLVSTMLQEIEVVKGR